MDRPPVSRVLSHAGRRDAPSNAIFAGNTVGRLTRKMTKVGRVKPCYPFKTGFGDSR
jgi:hypothetical protein